MERDWNDWRVCLAWLLDIYSAPELAEILSTSERTVYAWGNENKPSIPEHSSRRDLIELARRQQGMLKGIEVLAYHRRVGAERVPIPSAVFFEEQQQGPPPLDEDSAEDEKGLEPSGIPTDPRKRAEINARIREAQRQHGLIREDD